MVVDEAEGHVVALGHMGEGDVRGIPVDEAVAEKVGGEGIVVAGRRLREVVGGTEDQKPEAIAELIEAVRPQTVVNCIGLVKQLEAASKPLPAISLNALFPHEAAAACELSGAQFVHISTDCVFSGSLPSQSPCRTFSPWRCAMPAI